MLSAIEVETQPERIICLDCGQLLAFRATGGSIRVVVKGDETFLPDGRVEVRCPSCGRRVRIKPKRTAA
jgi:RNase P subunit RPR2